MRKMLKAWFVMGVVGLLVLAGCDGPKEPVSDHRAAQPLMKLSHLAR